MLFRVDLSQNLTEVIDYECQQSLEDEVTRSCRSSPTFLYSKFDTYMLETEKIVEEVSDFRYGGQVVSGWRVLGDICPLNGRGKPKCSKAEYLSVQSITQSYWIHDNTNSNGTLGLQQFTSHLPYYSIELGIHERVSTWQNMIVANANQPEISFGYLKELPDKPTIVVQDFPKAVVSGLSLGVRGNETEFFEPISDYTDALFTLNY